MFNDLLAKYGLSASEFGRIFNIPYVTVYTWAQGSRRPPEWLIPLFDEALERRCSHGSRLD